MGYEPLHHKYRPQTFTELVGQGAIAVTLSHALEQQRIAPAYLFCGPRGTGKTSSARILAKSLNCLSHEQPDPHPCGQCGVCQGINTGAILDIVEIDAASNTGVDNIRELIERAQFAPVQCRYKVYVIDECHMLSTAAFNALLKTLEEPPAQVVFVLATTDPQRVLPTIISRCQRFDFRRIPLEVMVAHLQMMAQQEAIQIEDTAVRLVAQVAQGGLRDAQSLLDQLSLLAPPVTAEKVWDLVGAVPERDLLELVQAIAADDGIAMLDTARRLMDRGREPMIVLQNLAGFYRDLMIAKTAAARADLVAVTPPTWDAMQTCVQGLPLSLLLSGQQTLRQAETQLRNTTQPRLWLEATLMGLLPSASRAVAAIAASPALAPVLPSPSPAPSPPLHGPPAAESASPGHASHPPSPTPSSAPEPPRSPAPATGSPPLPTSPAPAAATPPSNGASPSPPTAPVTADLSHIWAQVIATLEPLGTRALMQQQGHLMAYDGQVARIGIKSKPLFKMAQGRVTNIEAAFQSRFNRPVTVVLEVANPPDAPPAAPASPVAPKGGPGGAPLPPQSRYPGLPPEPPRTSPPPAAPHKPTSAPPMTAPDAWMPTSDFDRAVKNFADFFNGQIVSLEDPSDANESTTPAKPVPPEPLTPPDSDVPF